MRRTILLIASPLLMLLCAACGGSEGSLDPYREAASQAAQNSVLVLQDLPNGWAASSLGEESYANIQLTGECAPLTARGADFAGAVASADAEPFAGPLGQELVNTVTAFSGPDTATAAVTAANDLVLRCAQQIQDALRQAIEVAAEDRNVGGLLSDINTSVESDASFVDLGDESLAYALKADFSALFQRFEVNGHIIVIRDGPLAGVLVYAGLGDARPEEEQAVASTLADKLSRESSSLSN
jgi:hypothetical protein